MAICLRTLSHKILPINGMISIKSHSNRLTRKIPFRAQFLEEVSVLVISSAWGNNRVLFCYYLRRSWHSCYIFSHFTKASP